ncbi:B-cell receptor CD22-like [Hoplias malabaricus]|uniref:B-cell receptor CD22-like n=1 Tax=Hoplias malabaricus TaxID=27720 RepID=UPI0034635366
MNKEISRLRPFTDDSQLTLCVCSSDDNPPAELYTWFIEGGVSPVGSGHSYSPLQSGSYYCEARNEDGAQRSAPVSVLNGDSTVISVEVSDGPGQAEKPGLQDKLAGASGAEWSVKYNQQEICALKGSTVFMNGSYTHPDGLTVTEKFWVHNSELTDLRKDSDYSGRVEYFTDKQKNHFSLKLSNVEKKDEHQYCFRIITNQDSQKWLGKPGVPLKVTELRVETPGAVTEGGAAVLTCVTTCSLTDPTFIWYKNGRPLTTKTTTNNQLHLQPVSSEHAGSYSCAVNGYQHLPSPDHNLTVRYPPKNVSVSISSSGEIVEDSSVTLTCSSDANPPVEVYTWFIEGGVSPVRSGHSYSPVQSGSYYCEARNEHGAQRSAAFSVQGELIEDWFV